MAGSDGRGGAARLSSSSGSHECPGELEVKRGSDALVMGNVELDADCESGRRPRGRGATSGGRGCCLRGGGMRASRYKGRNRYNDG